MKKMENRAGRILSGLVVLCVALLIVVPVAMADEGTGGGGEGVISRTLGKLSNPFSNTSLGSLFSELSPADVGHKPRIKPHFAFNQGFNSNARLGPNQADAAWQARVAPGIGISIPSGKLYTEADYTYAFSTTQGRRTHANINTHNINALARYELSTDTAVGVGNNFQISEVPGAVGSTFTLDTATAQLRHRLSPKLSSSLGDTVQFFNDAGTNRQHDFVDNGVSGALSYDVTSDLSVGPTFDWHVRHFDKIKEKNYWQIQPAINATYRLGPKTSLGGNFGWALRRFDADAGHTESELIYGVSASHLLGRKFIWSLAYSKSLQDTFDTGFVFRDTPEVSALDNLDRDFRVVKSHRISSTATYNFNERNSVGAYGDFQLLETDNKDKITHNNANDEKAMEVGAKYTYRFNRYITFDVLYAFGRRFTSEINPTENRTNYTFHKISGGVSIAV